MSLNFTFVAGGPEWKKKNTFSKTVQSLKSGKSLGVFLLILILTWGAFGALQLKKLNTSYSVKQFLPKSDPLLKKEFYVKKVFNLDETPGFLVAITLADSERGRWMDPAYLSRMDRLTKKLSTTADVTNVAAISNVQGAVESRGTIDVGSIVKMTPVKDRAARIMHDPLLTPTLISEDGRTAMIAVSAGFLSIDRMTRLEKNIRSSVKAQFPRSVIRIGGVPAIQSDVSALLLKELRNFVIMAFIMAVISLALIFSNASGILITLAVMGLANIIVIGGFAFFGIPFTVLSTTIPILTSITVLAISSHTLLRIDEEIKKEPTLSDPRHRLKLICDVLTKLFLPNLLSALTTCVGFLTFMTVKVPLIKEYGFDTSVAVMAAWLFTQISLLCFLILFPLPKARGWTGRRARWSLLAMKVRVPVVVVVTLASAVLMLAGMRMNWSPRLFDDLPKGHPTRQATEHIDNKLGGTLPLEVVIQTQNAGAWNDPKLMARLSYFLKRARQIPGVGSAVGLSDFLNAAEFSGGKALSRKSIAETYFLYSLSPNDPLRNYLTADGKTTHISLRMHDLPALEMARRVSEINALGRKIFPDGQVITTGMAANVHRLNENLSKGLIFGFWQAMAIIGLLLILVFRSLRWAVVACLPNLVPPAVLIGSLGVLQTPIKPGIALIFSIALGLSFNNTVYLLQRVRQINKKNLSREGIRRAFYLESNSCMVATLVIFTGFIVFLGSYFSLNQEFGAFMLLSIIGGIIGDLIFLPALLMTFPSLLGKIRDTNLSDNVIDFPSPQPKVQTIPAKVAASVAFFLCCSTCHATDMTAADILKKAEQQISTASEVTDVKLRIVESDGSKKERQLEIRRKSGSKNFVLVRLQSPPDLRGTAFLSVYSKGKEDQWLYLPSSKQTRRIVGGNRQSGFLGSEISYEDLSATTAEGARIRWLRDYTFNGQKYALIETRGKKGNSPYSRVVSWITRTTYLMVRADYYDWNGKFVKQVTFQNYKRFPPGIWRAQIVKVRNFQNKRGTELILTGLPVYKNLPDSDFSVQALELN